GRILGNYTRPRHRRWAPKRLGHALLTRPGDSPRRRSQRDTAESVVVTGRMRFHHSERSTTGMIRQERYVAERKSRVRPEFAEAVKNSMGTLSQSEVALRSEISVGYVNRMVR